MESEIPSAGSVNSFDEKNTLGGAAPPGDFPRELPVELLNKVNRFNGYLEHTFENRKPYELMVHARKKFARKLGLSWDHVDRVSRAWMRWQTNFTISRERYTSRSTMIVIRKKYRSEVLTTAEVRRRLAGAIRNHVARWGQAHIDRKFLENFHRLYGLPPEQIAAAWRSLRYIEGCKSHWKGVGRGENFYVEAQKNAQVSPRQFSRGISPPTGGKEMKTAALPPSPEPQTDRARGAAPPHPLTEKLENTTHRPGEPPGGDVQKPSGWPEEEGDAPKPATNERAFHRWKPSSIPLHVCDRWVSAARLGRKAFWLALNPLMRATTEFRGVRWSAGHAVNFAKSALAAGFLDSEICAAWRVGLEETQASARRDFEASEARRDREGWVGDPWRPRELSQTVARAWLRLRADERSDEARWKEIFAGRANPAGKALSREGAKGAKEKPEEKPSSRAGSGAERSNADPAAPAAPRAETSAAGSAVVRPSRPSPLRETSFRGVAGARVRQLPEEREKPAAKKTRDIEFPDGSIYTVPAKFPDTTPAAKRAMGEGATFERYLTLRGLVLDDLLKKSRAEQQKFVREMHAWQKSGRHDLPK